MSDDFGFGLLSDDDKIENFEKSTLKLILAQMGFSKSSIHRLETAEGGLSVDWFNERFLADSKLIITRIFKFNFEDALFRPTKSEVVKYFYDAYDAFASRPASADLTMVFKVVGVGRMVATTFTPPSSAMLRVSTGTVPFHITTFPGFFTQWLGDNHEDIT